MRRLVPLAGYNLSTWPGRYAAHQLLGIRITTDRFALRGILPGDFAVILKTEFAECKEGDMVAITREGCVYIEEYRSEIEPYLLGRLLRSWRNY